MIDNYDSFTFNIVQYMSELGANLKVVRNDEITIKPPPISDIARSKTKDITNVKPFSFFLFIRIKFLQCFLY